MVNYKNGFQTKKPFLFYLHNNSKLSSKKESAHEKMLTKELSNELKKREGIISITVEPYEKSKLVEFV